MVLVYHVKLISSTINHYKTIWYSIINKFVQMKINVRQWRRSEGLFHQACRTTICLAAGRTSLTALALTLAVFRSGRETRRRRPDLPVFAGAVPHHLRVDGARDAVVQLGVQLGQLELVVDTGLSDVPDSGSLNNVADHKLLDGLVLGHAAGTVGATHNVDILASVLGASVVWAFLSHSHTDGDRRRPYCALLNLTSCEILSKRATARELYKQI